MKKTEGSVTSQTEGSGVFLMKKSKQYGIVTGILFILFALFTLVVKMIDVQAIGPMNAKVGLATLNQAAASFFGVHEIWYTITDYLGYLAIAAAFAFALWGLVQFIRRKSLWKVDSAILSLAGLYILVVAFYVFFEIVIVNYRPVLMEGVLEASYPSSHTMLVVAIMASAPIALKRLIGQHKAAVGIAQITAAIVIVVTVVGRMLSGVHWLTDIIGGVLLSAAIVMLYVSILSWLESEKESAL